MKSESNFPVSLAASSSEVHSLQRTIFRCSELWRFLEDLNCLKLKKTFAVAKYPSRSELWRSEQRLNNEARHSLQRNSFRVANSGGQNCYKRSITHFRIDTFTFYLVILI